MTRAGPTCHDHLPRKALHFAPRATCTLSAGPSHSQANFELMSRSGSCLPSKRWAEVRDCCSHCFGKQVASRMIAILQKLDCFGLPHCLRRLYVTCCDIVSQSKTRDKMVEEWKNVYTPWRFGFSRSGQFLVGSLNFKQSKTHGQLL